MNDVQMQSRNKSVLFWIGLVSAVYEAVLNSLVASGVQFNPTAAAILGAVGVALATVLIYCNGNNPSLTIY